MTTRNAPLAPLSWLARWRGRHNPGEPSHAPHKRLPGPFLWFLLVFLAGMILLSLVGDQGLIAYYGLQKRAQQLRGEVIHLEARKRDLSARIRALRENPAYIELLARQRLGLVKPDDVVIQLPNTRERP